MSLKARAALCYLVALADAIQVTFSSDLVLLACSAGMILVGSSFENMWRSSR